MKNNVVNVRVTDKFDLYIGREIKNEHHFFEKSKWHNPYKSKDYPDQDVVAMYENYITSSELYNQLEELDGLILGCWCSDQHRCHGGVLIKLLNEKKLYNMIINS